MNVKLLTVQQVADRLACSRPHVYDLIAAGKLRRFNVSAKADAGATKTRVADTDVDAYIASIEMPLPAAAS